MVFSQEFLGVFLALLWNTCEHMCLYTVTNLMKNKWIKTVQCKAAHKVSYINGTVLTLAPAN